jgi:pseudouridine kinase
MSRILVLGAACIDVLGISAPPFRPGDSNPGAVSFSLGGVATNIAVNLKRLGLSPTLVSAHGTGLFQDVIKRELAEVGLSTDHWPISDRGVPTFLGIDDDSGRLIGAVNDFSAIEETPSEAWLTAIEAFEPFEVVILDANLPGSAIDAFLVKYPLVKVFADGVSQAKVERLRPHLSRLDLIKMNRLELAALSQKHADDVILSVRDLIQQGARQVLVTNGGEPITYNIGRSIYQTVVFEAEHKVSALGCGDALFAGTIYGLLQGKAMHEAVNWGKKAASLTMEVPTATSPYLTPHALE